MQGFRYAKLTDWPEEVDPTAFEAIAVYSDMETILDFSCDNPLINQLVKNTLWSMKGNFLDVPTDCPTRERSAWLGDAQLFFDAGCQFMDLSAFFRKWIRDIYDDQAPDGKIYNIVPRCAAHEGMNSYVEGSSGWTDAGILLPYRHFLHYGDRHVMEQVYGGMERLIGFMTGRMGDTSDSELDKKLPDSPNRAYVVTSGFHFGEWNEPDSDPSSVMEPKYEVATAYLYYSLCCFSEMSGWLGYTEKAAQTKALAEKVKEAYQYYFMPDGHVHSKRMCELVRPAALGLADGIQKQALIDELAELVARRNYSIGTGFLSTPFVLPLLSEGGYDAIAWKMIENRSYPSWLYEVEQGATTIWENWDGVASRNHYSNGAVCLWLVQNACGIRETGENTFRIAPAAGGSEKQMRCSLKTRFGTVTSGWRKLERGEANYADDSAEAVEYTISIPVGCQAEIVLEKENIGIFAAGTYTFVRRIIL